MLCARAVVGVVKGAVGSMTVEAMKEGRGRRVGLVVEGCVHGHGVAVRRVRLVRWCYGVPLSFGPECEARNIVRLVGSVGGAPS